MKKISTQKKLILKACYLIAVGSILAFNASAQSFVEEFDDISTLFTNGWDSINHSANHASATTGWFQGNGSLVFPSLSGADANSYIGANYNNTTGTGTISNWLFAPTVTLNNGDMFYFYTRTTDSNLVDPANNWADRLQIRLSTNGSSVNVGSTSTQTGDFSTLLLDINPNLSTSNYPVGYPFTWTQFSITITGLSGPTSGRLAFRYFVTMGGPTGSNSDYIGIDSVNYIANPVGIESIGKQIKASLYPNPSNGSFRVCISSDKSQHGILEVTNELGQVVYNETISFGAGLTNHFMDLKMLSAGVYSMRLKTNEGMFNQKIVIQN